jgi:PTS system D-glucosamine-specific IIC component
MVGGLLTGLLMFLVWPAIQNGIYALGELVQSAGYFGTFIYGVIERALIPFGLHHIFYMPFWQTGVGGSMMIDGTMVEGAQNIFFAQLASPETTKFSIESTRFLVGKYPFMMGGLPGAALAMYTCAKPEKRKMAGSLLLSAAITSFVTGVTEPLEFTFLFLAPVLYGIHVVLAGISFAVCHILEICVGTTFSDGLIDLILYGVLPGQDKSNWMALIPVIIIYFIIYFLIFRTFILKMNLKTVGREDDDEEMHLVTKDEYRKATGVGVASSEKGKKAGAADEKSSLIVKGVGGLDNLEDIDCCATRLRLTLKDTGKVSEAVLKSTGASGVVIKGSGIQVIYGPSVTLVKSDLEEYVEKVKSGEIVVEEPVQDSVEKVEPKEEVQKPKMKDAKYHAHMNGTMKLMCEVEDETFARKILGDGIAVEPSEGKLFAPCNGTVAMVFDTKHAVVIESEEGSQILLHIGIDTVKLQGQHFEAHVSAGQEVKQGDLLVEFDMDAITNAGYKLTTPMIINNTDDYKEINPVKTGKVSKDDEILEVIG